MNKATRFSLMLALAALAFWSSLPKAAYALPLCDNLQGSSCPTAGRTIACLWAGGGNGTCTCDANTLTWDC